MLVIGADEGLLHSRSAVLRWGGFSTAECIFSDFGNFSAETVYRVAVLCHSIPRHVREDLSHRIRARWPGIPLVQMDRLLVFASDAKHADLTITAGDPKRLLSAVRELLSSPVSEG